MTSEQRLPNDTAPAPVARVVKRDGNAEPFDAAKIHSALTRAGAATGEFGDATAQQLTQQVLVLLAERKQAPSIEHIQDIVEHTLITAGFVKTARAYIAYREQHKRLREDRRTLLDVATSVNEYLDHQDWRINANANQGYSLGGLILNVSGKVTANYWLDPYP